jgi:hypothetical protein
MSKDLNLIDMNKMDWMMKTINKSFLTTRECKSINNLIEKIDIDITWIEDLVHSLMMNMMMMKMIWH